MTPPLHLLLSVFHGHVHPDSGAHAQECRRYTGWGAAPQFCEALIDDLLDRVAAPCSVNGRLAPLLYPVQFIVSLLIVLEFICLITIVRMASLVMLVLVLYCIIMIQI